jgi:hypothetical protein
MMLTLAFLHASMYKRDTFRKHPALHFPKFYLKINLSKQYLLDIVFWELNVLSL